jgi:hypothetical protein
MAILTVIVRFLLERQDEVSFKGRVLTLGRQTAVMTPAEYRKLFRTDEGPAKGGIVTDEDVFRALGATSVESLDYTADEGASVVHDLNCPLADDRLLNRYDMVLDGGTLEHCFNVGVYMETMLRLPKVGGTVLHFNPCQGYTNHGFYNFQPTFYFDYYGANGFTDMKCWLMELLSSNYYKFRARSRIIDVKDARKGLSFRSKKNTMVVFSARKRENVARVTIPIQKIYATRNARRGSRASG